jgi:hypothetical protein
MLAGPQESKAQSTYEKTPLLKEMRESFKITSKTYFAGLKRAYLANPKLSSVGPFLVVVLVKK